MIQITVISGKGGTGKTSIAGAFAVLTDHAVFADCDVDAANLGLLLSPRVRETHEFLSLPTAWIDPDLCTRCGLCEQSCRSDAIVDFKVDEYGCEGCGVCFHICPQRAVTMRDTPAGRWFVSDTPYGTLVHARLEPGRENSGKLVSAVRSRAADVAVAEGKRYLVVDGPPGTGCAVIASLSGASLALVVTEPTLSAIHDMERVLAVCRHFSVPAVVCINRWDLSPEHCRRIQNWCQESGIPVAGLIPCDKAVTEAMIRGLPVTEHGDGEASGKIRGLWQSVLTAAERG